MEFSSSSSPETSDAESKSSMDTPKAVRMPLPASILHGPPAGAERPAPAPSFELFGEAKTPERPQLRLVASEVAPTPVAEQHLPPVPVPEAAVRAAAEQHFRDNAERDDDDEEEKDDAAPAPPVVPRVEHHKPEIGKVIELPLRRQEWTPMDADPPIEEVIARTEAYDLPAPIAEPLAESAAATEQTAERPPEDSTRPKRHLHVVPPLPATETAPPSPEPAQPAYQEAAFQQPETTVEEPPAPPAHGGGGGGGRPPGPPVGAGSAPNRAGFGHNVLANTVPASANFLANLTANVLSPAHRLLVNARLARLEASRHMSGNIVTGLVAGWALERTFANRRKIKENERKAAKQTAEQTRVNNELRQQNANLTNRLNESAPPSVPRAEQLPPTPAAPVEPLTRRSQHAPQPTPERFATAAAAVPAVEATPGARPEAAKIYAAEQVRLVHEQQERVLRQQELEVPEGHHLERSSWLTQEVVNDTGQVVEAPTSFEYGKAFHDESRVEQQQDLPQSALNQTPGGLPGGMQSSSGLSPLPPLPTRSLPGTPAVQDYRATAKGQAGLKQTVSKITSDRWVWAGVAFIVLVFLVATLI